MARKIISGLALEAGQIISWRDEKLECEFFGIVKEVVWRECLGEIEVIIEAFIKALGGSISFSTKRLAELGGEVIGSAELLFRANTYSTAEKAGARQVEALAKEVNQLRDSLSEKEKEFRHWANIFPRFFR